MTLLPLMPILTEFRMLDRIPYGHGMSAIQTKVVSVFPMIERDSKETETVDAISAK
jgi:hypothetical protein